MHRSRVMTCCALLAVTLPHEAFAVTSAELYTAASYPYGRFEARARLAAGDGVVSTFFLWKDGSEQAGAFWNELDFEKVGAECRLETNPLYGNPATVHAQRHTLALDLCGAYHTYAYEWTPQAIVWRVDGMEIRRETGATAQAFADNAGQPGMQIHINLWPGDASFGGNFSPSILPVHQYVDWVQYSTYENGSFNLTWRDDFDGSVLHERWLTGNWGSPKNLSTHAAANVNVLSGHAVLSLTTDNALGPAGAMPGGAGGAAGSSAGGAAGSGGSAGSSAGGSVTNGGSTAAGGATGASGSATTGGGGASSGGGVNGGASTTGGVGTSGGVSASGGASVGVGVGGSTTGGVTSSAAPGSFRSARGSCSFERAPRTESGLGGLGLAALVWLARRRRANARCISPT